MTKKKETVKAPQQQPAPQPQPQPQPSNFEISLEGMKELGECLEQVNLGKYAKIAIITCINEVALPQFREEAKKG